MKVIELQTFTLDSVSLAERPEPRPGPGEVLIRVRACSLNYRDLLVVKGLYNPKLPLPLVPLSDGAGEVTAVGPGVTRVKVGERVAGCFMQGWIDGEPTEAKAKSALGGGGVGMARRVCRAAGRGGRARIPTISARRKRRRCRVAAVTAWHALVSEGGVKAGDMVLTQGTGGVSIFALQFAKLLGARDPRHVEQRRQAARASCRWAPATASTTKRRRNGAHEVRELTGSGRRSRR